ncbi:MAG: PAS domain S-box protein [Steroidobacteraceae bacterium]
MRAVLDAAVDAVIIIDGRGLIETFNRAAERMFGFEADEILGQNISRLMPEPDRSNHDGYLETYLRTGRARIIGRGREVTAQHRDGSVFPVSLAVGRIDGDEPRFVGFLHDLSEHKRVEAAAHQAQERVAQFARLSTMGEMAAGLAHEINQPLTAVATYAQAVQRMIDRPEVDPEEINHALAQITAQALRAGDVIQRLRAFVRNRDTRQELVDMGRLVRDTLTFAGPDARVNEVRLQAELTEVPSITCDPIQIQQVMLNLIRNAIDATNEVRDTLREVTVRILRTSATEIEISVEDHGKGVSEDVARRLGDPFFTTKSAGTGLGVAISRSIVRAHGGKLGHRPTPGGGATFHFTLPVGPGSKA